MTIIYNNSTQKFYNIILSLVTLIKLISTFIHKLPSKDFHSIYSIVIIILEVIVILAIIMMAYINYKEYKFYKKVEDGQRHI